MEKGFPDSSKRDGGKSKKNKATDDAPPVKNLRSRTIVLNTSLKDKDVSNVKTGLGADLEPRIETNDEADLNKEFPTMEAVYGTPSKVKNSGVTRNVWEPQMGEKITSDNPCGAGVNNYANLLNAGSSNKKVNFRTLVAPTCDGADVAIPLSSVIEVKERLGNTIYGYFLGKRIAFPVVENYAKNAWTKYGLQKTMMNSNGFFFFKFGSTKGMDEVLENGPWMIRTAPIIIRKWSPIVNLVKENLSNIPVWVKLHNVPISAFTEDGLSVIATKLGTPVMLDSYTSSMCAESWGRSSYARAMIEVRADSALKETIVVAVPRLEDAGFNISTIRVEYDWKPPRCEACKVFGHCDDQCPKNIATRGQQARGIPVGLKAKPLFVYRRKNTSKPVEKEHSTSNTVKNHAHGDTGTKVSNAFEVLNSMAGKEVTDIREPSAPSNEKVENTRADQVENMEKMEEVVKPGPMDRNVSTTEKVVNKEDHGKNGASTDDSMADNSSLYSRWNDAYGVDVTNSHLVDDDDDDDILDPIDDQMAKYMSIHDKKGGGKI